ncbi:hypothetical protein MHYP_G00262960 [Metynnis hypsauchen]
MDQKEKQLARKEVHGSNFATNVAAESKAPQETHVKPTNTSKTMNAFDKPCLYCQQSHNLASCSKIKCQPHNEYVEFLKSKGLCFGCLVAGHLSKFCIRKLEYKECALKHPDILHKVKEEGSVSPEKKVGAHGKEVSCAEVPITKESCGILFLNTLLGVTASPPCLSLTIKDVTILQEKSLSLHSLFHRQPLRIRNHRLSRTSTQHLLFGYDSQTIFPRRFNRDRCHWSWRSPCNCLHCAKDPARWKSHISTAHIYHWDIKQTFLRSHQSRGYKQAFWKLPIFEA